jgi:inorganic pyrophosphatase
MAELQNFFEGYKTLEKKTVRVGNMLGRDAARQCIARSMEAYQQKFKE